MCLIGFFFIVVSAAVVVGSGFDLYHEITWYKLTDVRAAALNIFGLMVGGVGLMTGIILI